MGGGYTRLPDRVDVLAAAGDHPYARYNAVGEVAGYRSGAVVAWRFGRPGRWSVAALGDPGAALDLVRATGLAADVEWLHLPRLTPAQSAQVRASTHDDWDFLVTRSAPPLDGAGAARLLDASADPAVNALLDVAFPVSVARPGDDRVRCWYGVHEDGELIAAAADRSRGGAGAIGGVVVHPAHRRRGLGSAVTAALTRALLTEFPAVTLGVMADAVDTRRVYERLGFGGHLLRTSLRTSG